MLPFSRKIPAHALALVVFAAAVCGQGIGRAGDELPSTEALLPGLEAILASAAAQSPRMVTENLSRLEAEYYADAARAALYPTAGGYSRFQYQREQRLSEGEAPYNNVKSYYQFEISQPVFHWGSIKADVDIGRIRQDIANRYYTRAYQLLANEIRAAYLSLIIEKVDLRSTRHQLDRQEARLEIVRQRVAEGIEVAGTVAAIELGIEEGALNLERRESGFAFRLRQFKWLTGLESFAAEQLPDTIPQIPGFEPARPGLLRTEYVTRRGFESDPRYATNVQEIQAQKLGLKILKNSLKPKFNLTLGINQDEVDRTGNVEEKYQLQALYAGVFLNWTIFDSFRSRANTRAAQMRLRKQERALEQAEEELLRAMEQAEAELGFSVRALRFAEIRWTGAVSGRDVAIDFVKQGRMSQDDVELANTAMLAAEVNVCRARADCLNAISAFNTVLNADPFIKKLATDSKLAP